MDSGPDHGRFPVAPPLWMDVPSAEAPAFAGMTEVVHRSHRGWAVVVDDAFKNLSGWAAGLRCGLSLLLDFKRPGGGARRVVKVCSRRMRGARFLYLESSPRLRVASELVDG